MKNGDGFILCFLMYGAKID